MESSKVSCLSYAGDEEVDCNAPQQQTHMPRSFPRLLLSITFIICSSLWLVYSGLKYRLIVASERSIEPIRKPTEDLLNLSGDTMAAAASRTAPFILNSSGKATGLVIFLHGLGDSGQGWSLAFANSREKHVRYVFPNANEMPVTLNYGMVMPSWFDLVSLDMKGAEDESGIKMAAEQIRTLVKTEQEKAGVPSDRVILGGFSMGGALALYTSLTHPQPLGGLLLLSSWLPLREHFQKNTNEANFTSQMCPIFQAHGNADNMVPIKFGKATHKLLKDGRGSEGSTIFKEYEGLGHSSSDKELDDAREFIKARLPAV